MNTQTSQLVSTLKRCLRARGITYRDVAKALRISESSVKRLFSEQTFSLQRLEEICRLLEMSVLDLARLAAGQHDGGVPELSETQEQALVDDPVMLAFFYLLLIGWKPARISRRLGLGSAARLSCLGRLAKLGLVELAPRDRVRLRVDPRVHWRPGGPIRQRFEQQVKEEFVDYAFGAGADLLALENGELSEASISVLLRKLRQLSDDFAELVDLDRHLPHADKRGFGLMLAARPWTFWNAIERLARK